MPFDILTYLIANKYIRLEIFGVRTAPQVDHARFGLRIEVVEMQQRYHDGP